MYNVMVSEKGVWLAGSPGEPLYVVCLALGRLHEAKQLQLRHGLDEPGTETWSGTTTRKAAA